MLRLQHEAISPGGSGADHIPPPVVRALILKPRCRCAPLPKRIRQRVTYSVGFAQVLESLADP